MLSCAKPIYHAVEVGLTSFPVFSILLPRCSTWFPEHSGGCYVVAISSSKDVFLAYSPKSKELLGPLFQCTSRRFFNSGSLGKKVLHAK